MLSEQQQRIYDEFISLGSANGVAKKLGLSRGTVRSYLARAAEKGHAPGLIKAQDVPGFKMSKTTVAYDAAGRKTMEWRRLSPDVADVESWVCALEDRVKDKAPKIAKPTKVDDDLLLEIPIPDHHMGMLSWSKETGADYDCAIATKLLINGVRSILADVNAPSRIVLSVIGDYYHSDNRSGMTEKSGHVLDVDSRFSRRVDHGIEALCSAIELCAACAKQVDVIILSGNHDWHSAKWLSRVVASYYHNVKHVKVHTDPSPRAYVKHGNVLLAYMHGDTMKAAKFAQVVPAERQSLWGETKFRYGRVGHWHHRVTEEHPGIVIETLPTLAAPDAYAIEHGYISRRAITAYLWSGKWGLRSKMERSPEEIMQ